MGEGLQIGPEGLRSVRAALWATRWTAVVPWGVAYLASLVAVVAALVAIDAAGRYELVALVVLPGSMVVWLVGGTQSAVALADHYRSGGGLGSVRFRRALARTAVLAAVVAAGWLCFIAPALYLVARFGPVLLFANPDEGVRASFARTSLATEGRRWAVLGWAVVGSLVAATGFYVALVGAVVTVPAGLALTTCAWAGVLDLDRTRADGRAVAPPVRQSDRPAGR